MPATITHAYFAEDVYKRLNTYNKSLIDENLIQYKMFSQSTDSLMFYNIENLKKGKEIREFQYTFHTTKTQDFFCCLAKKIKNKKLFNNKSVMCYLYGMICHYVLDSNIHPFIYYKTGYFNKHDKSSYKYNNQHSYMETFLDLYLMKEKGKISFDKLNINTFTFDLKPFDFDLIEIINSCFFDVYGIRDMAKIYYISLKQMCRFIKRYRIDKTGIKKLLYKSIDKFTPKNIFKFEALSYNYKFKNEEIYLNNNHNIWFNPIEPSIFSYESFSDLYEKSIDEAINIINNLTDYFNGKNIDIKKVFTNKSYVSGLNCNIDLIFKKFEY